MGSSQHSWHTQAAADAWGWRCAIPPQTVASLRAIATKEMRLRQGSRTGAKKKQARPQHRDQDTDVATIASTDLSTQLDRLRERIFAGDNTHCFVERQSVLAKLAPLPDTIPEKTRYATILERLLSSASTPIEPEDVILGRMVEGALPPGSDYHHALPGFGSAGHLTPDWPALLSRGLLAIAAEARDTAQRLGDDEARAFAENTTRCCEAITAFAQCYAASALAQAQQATAGRDEELIRAARALQAAPAGPAPDFFAALQAIWIVHLVLSCFIGARDFAFGRLDQYLLPLYRQGLAEGTLTPDLALAYLAHFLMKMKEITGTTTDTYHPKPVPCFASNQYVVLGGSSPEGRSQANELQADALARRVCEIGLDALEAAPNPDGFLLLPSIYSLYCHIGWGQQLPATPDGRLPGEPISENQSPVHGTDRAGLTALLRSVARLPLGSTPMGGLNLRLAFRPEPETALQLLESFFALGGIHLGFTFVDRATLLAAQATPAEYRSLCVRITGFSEFFTALSPEGQADVIARTEY